MSDITPLSPFDEALERQKPPPEHPVAGWWPRVGAALIDGCVRVAIVAVLAGVGALLYLSGDEAGQVGLGAGVILGVLFGWFVYAPLLLARWDGQTVGHRAVDTRIVMADGARMPGGRGFVREALVKNLLIETIGSFTLVLPILNYLWPLWDERSQALHDKLCDTLVVTV